MTIANFSPMPDYGLSTAVPFTYSDTRTWMEYVEALRAAVVELQNIYNADAGKVDTLVNDANKFIEENLALIGSLTSGYEGQLNDMIALGDKMDEAVRALDAARESVPVELAKVREAMVVLRDEIAKNVSEAIKSKVDKREFYFSATDYAAKGDGVVDDTAALNAALKAAGEGGAVYLPRGEYRTTGPLVMLKGQRLFSHTGSYKGGTGEGGSLYATIRAEHQSACITAGLNAQIDGIALVGPLYSTGNSIGIAAASTSGITLRDVYIREFNVGISISSIWYTHLDHVFVQRCATAFKVRYCYNVSCYNLRISGFLDETTDHPDGIGIVMEDRSLVYLHGGSIEQTRYAVHIPKDNNRQQLGMFGVYMETYCKDGIGVQIESRDNLVTALSCLVYVTNYAAWINAYTNNGTATVFARGTKFKGGTVGEKFLAYRWHLNGGVQRFDVSGDSWVDVVDDDDNIRYCSDTLPSGSRVMRPYGTGSVGGFNMSESVQSTQVEYHDATYVVPQPVGPSLPPMTNHARQVGTCYFSTTHSKPLWWTGAAWVDGSGTPV